MLDFSQTNIVRLAITWACNKELNEGVVIPKSTLVTVNDYVHQILTTTFFKPFEKNEEFFYFTHDEDVSHNAAYQSCVRIFENPDTLSEEAAALTQRLYEMSTEPKMKGGEFFMALFDSVVLEGEAMPAIGIFKIVQKDPFLRVEKTTETFALQVGEGIGSGKLAMAALIFGIDEAEGYRIMAMDNVVKKDTPSVWLTKFLVTKPIEDNYFNTRHYMSMASEFITEKAPAKFGLDKTDTVDLLNRSALYFKENDNFEIEDFTKTLFPDDAEQQEVFKEYKQEYADTAEIPLSDQFDISKQAMRKSSKVFKKVIKLDDNFHIYVHGRRELIERGYDEEKGQTFYKIFFDQEE